MKMKLAMIRLEDERQEKRGRSGTRYKMLMAVVERKPTEEFSGSYTNYSVHEASLHSSSS